MPAPPNFDLNKSKGTPSPGRRSQPIQLPSTELVIRSASFQHRPEDSMPDQPTLSTPSSPVSNAASFFRNSQSQGHSGLQGSHQSRKSNFFSNLFFRVKDWVMNFATIPTKAANGFILSRLRDLTELRPSPEISIDLMTSSRTFHLAVIKLVSFEMSNLAFDLDMFRDFKAKYNERLNSERQGTYNGMPKEERKTLAEERMRVVKEILHEDEWEQHHQLLAQQQCSKLWHMLQPLLAKDFNTHIAWNSLFTLWRDVLTLGAQMHQEVSLFDVIYPPIGDNSSYNPGQMIEVARSSKVHSQTTSSRRLQRLRLGISPCITEKSWDQQGNIKSSILCKAAVLLENDDEEKNSREARAPDEIWISARCMRGLMFWI